MLSLMKLMNNNLPVEPTILLLLLRTLIFINNFLCYALLSYNHLKEKSIVQKQLLRLISIIINLLFLLVLRNYPLNHRILMSSLRKLHSINLLKLWCVLHYWLRHISFKYKELRKRKSLWIELNPRKVFFLVFKLPKNLFANRKNEMRCTFPFLPLYHHNLISSFFSFTLS